ncbi:folylpolyglutamate synthase, mitochondrial-like isoform X3 [Rhynchophorus ferrugineus]|uniref:folylpolyglutamate synthase, mitochondrial-like isoform X3 n=1 Tax=Rhynchophorus ferrugineus TaxID=354439 RepID=UPI003FCD91CB
MSKTYLESISTLNNLISNSEHVKASKYYKPHPTNNRLEMMRCLNRLDIDMQELDSLKIIHVTGTKGKGSTCSYIENILRTHGYKTGLYTSPHLLEVRERIRLNGNPISRDLFCKHFWNVYSTLEQTKTNQYDLPPYFCFLTLMAFHVFIKEKVDVTILEVGIGGEYDCTNIIRYPFVVAFTPLDLDHTGVLGNTLESIAWNKAGIMKPGAKAFTVNQPQEAMEVLKERSIERQCPLLQVNGLKFQDIRTSKPPSQIIAENGGLALSVAEAFINIDNGTDNTTPYIKTFNLDLAKEAIRMTKWPGRYEIYYRNNCIFYLDGAHTQNSLKITSEWFLSRSVKKERKRALIFNAIGVRDSAHLLGLLLKCEFNLVIFMPNITDDSKELFDTIQDVQTQLDRCQSHMKIWYNFNTLAEIRIFPSFLKALIHLEEFQHLKYDVLVTGSIHLVGAVMKVLDPSLEGILSNTETNLSI